MPSSTLLLGRRRTAAPPSATPKGYPHGKLAGVKKKRIFGNKKFRCWKPKKHSIVVVSLFVWSTVPNPCGIEGAAHANTHAILWSPPHRCRNVCIISSKTCGHPARRRRTNAISWLSSAPPRDVQDGAMCPNSSRIPWDDTIEDAGFHSQNGAWCVMTRSVRFVQKKKTRSVRMWLTYRGDARGVVVWRDDVCCLVRQGTDASSSHGGKEFDRGSRKPARQARWDPRPIDAWHNILA